MIKNEYTIEGETVIFHITRRNGEKCNVLIDKEDLQKIDNLNLKIHVGLHTKGKKKIYYAEITQYLSNKPGEKKNRILLLHRIIMNEQDTKNKVDHRNYDTLDNRKYNLRVSKQSENLRNRDGANQNNKTGFRNVCWIENENLYTVQLMVDGKNTRLGEFNANELDKAVKFAEEMRQEYYGEFKGRS